MNLVGKILFVLILISPLLTGCTTQTGGDQSGGGNQNTGGNVQAKFSLPVYLQYTSTKYVDNEAIDYTVDLWLESEIECDGKDTYAGLMKYTEQGSSRYSKITVYRDDGTMGMSTWTDEASLAFDNAVSRSVDMDYPLFMNLMYGYANKNFLTSSVWSSATPELLKDVVISYIIANYSVSNKGNSSKYIVPCEMFKFAMQTGYGSNSYDCCVLDKDEYEISFTVNCTLSTGPATSWQLTEYEEVSSGISFYPQCLKFVKCPYADLSIQCGPNEISNPTTDEYGCVTGVECLTLVEAAEIRIRGDQPESCELVEGLEQKMLDCYSALGTSAFNRGEHYDYTLDAEGCITDFVCYATQ